MKKLPFDLAKALAGAKLVTRDGSKATEFRKNPDVTNNETHPWLVTIHGIPFHYRDNGTSLDEVWEYDLFLLDESEDVVPAPPMPTVFPPWMTERKFYAAIALNALSPSICTVEGAAIWKGVAELQKMHESEVLAQACINLADAMMAKLNKEPNK